MLNVVIGLAEAGGRTVVRQVEVGKGKQHKYRFVRQEHKLGPG